MIDLYSDKFYACIQEYMYAVKIDCF